MSHAYTKVIVDEFSSMAGAGYYIRFDDGTAYGDMTAAPIAIVYSLVNAQLVAAALNRSNIVPFLIAE